MKDIASFLNEARAEGKISLAQASSIYSCVAFVAKLYDEEASAKAFKSQYGHLAYLQTKEFTFEN